MRYTSFEDLQDVNMKHMQEGWAQATLWKEVALQLMGQIEDDDYIDIVADLVASNEMDVNEIQNRTVRDRVNEELIKRLEKGGL